MTQRFKLSEVSLGSDFAVFLYDLRSKALVPEVCDYALELVNILQLTRSTVVQEITHLRVFWSFLSARRINVKDLTDSILKEFREETLAQALSSPAHRGDVDSSRKTVNAKLVRIYDWLLWLQETKQLPGGTLGPTTSPILTTLSGSSLTGERYKRHRGPRPPMAYPLLLRIATANTKHAVPHSIPTEDTVDALHSHFFAHGSSEYLAKRNSLMVDIAAYTGFRRGSIQSLRVMQFVGHEFALTGRDTVILKPVRQKFNYGNSFEIPLYLHEQVKAFIGESLVPFLESGRIPRARHLDHLFVSSRSGRPLSDGAMTSIVSKAMRAVGLKKGSSLHSFRAKFTNEEVEEEYRNRVELGLNTSTESVGLAVSNKLGHRSADSIRAYTSKYESSKVAQRRGEKLSKLEIANKRIEQLEAQLAAKDSTRS